MNNLIKQLEKIILIKLTKSQEKELIKFLINVRMRNRKEFYDEMEILLNQEHD